MEEQAEIEIVEQILDGKTHLFRVIVERYQNSVFSFMMRFTGSRSAAEDLTQESFMKAFAALNRFDRGKKLFPWIYTIAMNTARDWNRKNQRQPRTVAIEDRDLETGTYDFSGNKSGPEAATAMKEELDQVNTALAALTPEYREAVILRYRYDLSPLEISQIFNISESASKMRVHRGLKLLRQAIKPIPGSGPGNEVSPLQKIDSGKEIGLGKEIGHG